MMVESRGLDAELGQANVSDREACEAKSKKFRKDAELGQANVPSARIAPRWEAPWQREELDDSDREAYEAKSKKFRRNEELKDIEVEQKMQLRRDATKRARDAKENETKEWGQLKGVLGLDQKSEGGGHVKQGLVELMYFAVLVGCELDLYGFMLAFRPYWDTGFLVVRLLICACPAFYLLAVALYIYYPQDQADVANIEAQPERHNPQRQETRAHRPTAFSRAQNAATAQPAAVEAVPATPTRPMLNKWADKLRKEPIDLRFYHFLPGVRYYIVIKDKVPSDIEGLFRVNSLSSFSLGIAQLVGIIFVTAFTEEDPDVFVIINIVSQCVNWLITLIYFLTPVSEMMKGALEVKTLKYNTDQDLRKKSKAWFALSQDVWDPEAGSEKQGFVRQVDLEIMSLSNIDLDLEVLDTFNIVNKLEALRILRNQNVWRFMKIGQ